MADAISGLGGGGQATPYTVNAATAASYSAVATVSLLGGPLASRLGVKALLIFGAVTFPINGSAYYVNSRYGIQWYLIFGRFVYGLGFGAWYVAEAAIILSYPEERSRGKYLAVWVMSRNLGQLVGGSISLARNIKMAGAGAIATSTYLIFVGIEAAAFPISWLISPPHKVRRNDGTAIRPGQKLPIVDELWLVWAALKHKRTLLLSAYFFYSYFYGGVLGTYLTLYFSVRARAMSSIIVPGGIIVFVFLYGLILDNKRWNMKRRAQIGFIVVTVPTLVSFCWLVANQKKFIDKPPGKMDWTASGWANAYVPFYMMQILGYMCQTYIYWLISCFADDVNANARNGGVFRAIEAIGQAVSYGINAKAGNRMIPLGINFGLFILAIPGLVMVVQSVPKEREETLQESLPIGEEAGMSATVPEIKNS
ncbi:hypothetical protein FFLO_05723 [Filobasidium floriforme]|uniref:Uncharacterized protein n=1 Tax=Filobasidium floriforme TaxID=5210 RepID=A0A8K0JI24_9TREE|nr:uncharacterized protein HD553DRAFT_269716 [Filobasidium floriforme]KAG7529371.1 hypothetical protein FFLO_05723 [Filobasidium floriforme]KAH8087311.1 membrane protein [Filobasidium floriforme]